jgi:hypothetical protein
MNPMKAAASNAERCRCYICFSLLLLVTYLSLPKFCNAQADTPGDLAQGGNTRVPEGRVEGSFVEALGEAARTFKVPMGIAWVKTESAQRKRTIEYKDATVLEIIQKIAQTEPGYQVAVTDKMVHVVTHDVPAKENFLDLRIPSFSGTGAAPVVKASLWILLNQEIAPNPPQAYKTNIPHRASDPKLNLEFTNATVEEILDSIAVASNEKIWTVTFEGEASLLPSGFRRTEAYGSNAPAPDSQQPVWDIFRWDEWPLKPVTPPAAAP